MKNSGSVLRFYHILLLCAVLTITSCGPSLPEDVAEVYDDLPKNIDYNLHVKPILSDRCFACHGNDINKLKAGLRLDNAKDAYAALIAGSGGVAIAPKSLRKSLVYQRIMSSDLDQVMPPPESNLNLTPSEKAVITKWIKQGAEYKDHWAFLGPAKVKAKPSKQKEWIRNEIDDYTIAKLEENDWKPSEEADKSTMLRRISLDLTGLPPSPEEVRDFVGDASDDAYELAVDRLLASSAYGERMAAEWMDLARFADTHGYTVDRYRDMSPCRDWVIKALNENMPMDQFVTWQLAGDLLPNASKEQIIATGFNRNHQQNMEGGIIPEEFRVEYVMDRANTFGTAFLGLTVECARCHDHKYDPISQKEYFELYSFFNNVNEAGQISFDNAMPVPTVLIMDEKVEGVVAFIDKQIKVKQDKRNLPDLDKWLNSNPKIDLKINKPIAHLSFDGSLGASEMRQQGTSEVSAEFEEGSIKLNGDAWVDLKGVGAFNKDQSFSVKIRLKLPAKLKNGVIFHKGEGAALYNFRGFHLAIKDNRLEALMARTSPDNAIIKRGADLPRDRWLELVMTYDGSSEAEGLRVFLDGDLLAMETEVDNLYKDFMFGRENEPGLQIGARWRGVGIKDALVDDVKVFETELSHLEISGDLNPGKELLEEYYWLNIDRQQKAYQKELYEIRRSKTLTLDTLQEVMVIKEMETPRQSYILQRGLYDQYGEEVFPGTITSVLPFNDSLPRNRLGLSNWLFDEENPLTARVAVNRIWQQFFGRGIVRSANDFGNQGNMPTHPELLDYLALEFMNSGWDQKALIRKIVMSATYRQSSVLREEMLAVDSDNIFLWRGPSDRLSAEMMRDNALAASGLLVDKVGGPSVKPYQPTGLWSINGGRYEKDSGEDLYRRSLYTFWKRSVPNPTQAIFDAPSRSTCSVSRQKTNTPLQALVLMNDTTFLEAAKVLGEGISRTENVEIAIAEAFLKLTGRAPRAEELQILTALRDQEYEKFVRNPDKMKGWLEAGVYSIESDVSPAEIAANTVVASTIINSDATIIKR